jgi:AcrR family transcriptional regulator
MDMDPAAPQTDGRLARGERARTAICDAMLDLIEQGDLRPTAPRIAERAGVSLRTVFQHFRDLEALFATVSDRHAARLRPVLQPIQTDGSLEERIDAFVRQRARFLEALTPVRRSAVLMEPFSPEVARQLGRVRKLGRVEVERVFAIELGRRSPAERREIVAALTAASCWATWESLRRHQGLALPAARKVLARTMAALLTARTPA